MSLTEYQKGYQPLMVDDLLEDESAETDNTDYCSYCNRTFDPEMGISDECNGECGNNTHEYDYVDGFTELKF